MKILLPAAALLTLASPISAQSQTEAAQGNILLAMQTCVQNYHDPQNALSEFARVGFTHTPEDFGGGDVLHHYTTPGGEMSATVALTNGSLECRIGTSLWGVESMLPFAKAAFSTVTNGFEIHDGGPEGQKVLPGTPAAQSQPCSGFTTFLPRSMTWVQILRQGNDGTCTSDGTSVIRMIFG